MDLGITLESFWVTLTSFGIIFVYEGPIWYHFGIILELLGSLWGHPEITLALLWALWGPLGSLCIHFGVTSKSFWVCVGLVWCHFGVTLRRWGPLSCRRGATLALLWGFRGRFVIDSGLVLGKVNQFRMFLFDFGLPLV